MHGDQNKADIESKKIDSPVVLCPFRFPELQNCGVSRLIGRSRAHAERTIVATYFLPAHSMAWYGWRRKWGWVRIEQDSIAQHKGRQSNSMSRAKHKVEIMSRFESLLGAFFSSTARYLGSITGVGNLEGSRIE